VAAGYVERLMVLKTGDLILDREFLTFQVVESDLIGHRSTSFMLQSVVEIRVAILKGVDPSISRHEHTS
jgi:hypothetical protein